MFCDRRELKGPGNRHSRPHARNTLVQPNQEGGADGAHEFSPVQRLLLPCAIGFESLARFIRDQSDRQLVFGLEGVEGGDRIGRNADDLGSEPGESPLQPGEIEGFPGAAGRVGARINGAPAVPP